jgi:response regulator RpfG family c-di-GMP phosphodiesterase
MKRKIKLDGHSNGRGIGDQTDVSAAPDRKCAEPGAVRKTRILIVEDEPAMVAGLRDNFEYEGYEVISAADGAEGLDRALADNPDLVVLDVMRPRMSGMHV